MRLERATNADLDALEELERACFAGAARSRATLEGALNRRRFRLARESEAIVGYVVAQLVGDEAEIERLAVVPSCQRRGIGARLLQAILAELRDAGAARVWLEVRAGNAPARRLYAAHGFAETGHRPRYYGDENAVICGLEFEAQGAGWSRKTATFPAATFDPET